MSSWGLRRNDIRKRSTFACCITVSLEFDCSASEELHCGFCRFHVHHYSLQQADRISPETHARCYYPIVDLHPNRLDRPDLNQALITSGTCRIFVSDI